MSKNLDQAKEQLENLIQTRARYRKNLAEAVKNKDEALVLGKQGTAQDYQTEIDRIEEGLNNLSQQISEFEKEIKIVEEEEINKSTNLISEFGKKYNFRWIADMSRFISLKNEHGTLDKINLVYKQSKKEDIIGILNVWSKNPGYFDKFSWQNIRYMCEKNNLAYESLQVSFNKEKWSGGHSFNLMTVMQNYWIKIDPRVLDQTIDADDDALKYNSLLDDWLYTLNGGKEENILHTKEFIIQKLLYPEQFTDSGSLNPYYTGTPGGNGKGILVIILATIFTPMSIVMSRAKEMSESFNSRQQGKIFNIIDEGDEGHISQAVLKKRSGSEEIVIEGKGLEPVTMDRTESMIIFDNSGNTVELKGPGEDRRWSIIETNIVMIDYFVKKHNISREEAAEICSYIAELAKDRNEINKMLNRWMFDLIKKYQNFYQQHRRLPKLVALHGQDYRNRLSSKQDSITEIFEELLPVLDKYKFIPWKWLKDIVETRNHHLADNVLSDKFDEFMKRHGYPEIKRSNVHTRVLWRGVDTGIEHKGMIRRFGNSQNSFDFANICSMKYAKGISITENTVNINTENTWAAQSDLQNLQENLNFSRANRREIY